MSSELMCCECDEPATWIRCTQFAGNHHFCITHAQQEENFGKSNSPYFYWVEIFVSEVSQKKHPVKVAGFNGSFKELAEAIFRMRYDKIGEFLHYCAIELRRQAENDRKRGRYQLSGMLHGVAKAEEHQRKCFFKIYNLCKRHMKDELE